MQNQGDPVTQVPVVFFSFPVLNISFSEGLAHLPKHQKSIALLGDKCYMCCMHDTSGMIQGLLLF